MKRKIICIILSLLLTSSALFLRVSSNYSIACDIYAVNGIKSKVLYEVNSLLYHYFDGMTDSLIYKEYSLDGKINQISVNTIELNKFASELTNKINYKINSEKYDFGLPIGNTLGVKYFSGKGPKIKVNIQQIGSTEFEVFSDFSSCGINQILHRIILRFYIEIDCLAPFHSISIMLEPSVVLSETLIVGEVPDVLFPKG